MDQNEDVQVTEIEHLAAAEKARVDGYRAIYEETHHILPKKTLVFREELGLDALFFWISGVAGLLVIALRTATVFMQSESALLQADILIPAAIKLGVAISSGIAAMLFVECFLFGYGLSQGKKSNEFKVDKLGFGIAFAISAIAGLLSMFKIGNFSAQANSGVNILLTLAVGVGGSALVWRTSHNIGILNNIWKKMQKDVDDEYEKYLLDWEEKFQASYTKRGAYLMGNDIYRKLANEDREVKSKQKDQEEKELGSLRIRVEQWLDARGYTAEDVRSTGDLTPKHIADELGLAKSDNVRTILSRMRSEKVRNQPVSEPDQPKGEQL